MRELQFIRGSGQGNIYSTSRFGKVLLAASGNYGRVLAHVDPTTLLELPLSSIPIGSDIIAVDACQDVHHIIGVTFIQSTQIGIEEIKTPYLNFYASWAPLLEIHEDVQASPSPSRSSDSSSSSRSSTSSTTRFKNLSKDNLHLRQLETLGQKCVQFKLNFIPYHLCHTRVKNAAGMYEPLFLLSGSDCRIHIYKPTSETESFTQVPIQIYFPELYGVFPSVVSRVQIVKLKYPRRRVTICGFEDGQLKSFIISKSETARNLPPIPALYRKKSSIGSDQVFQEDEDHSSDDEDKESRLSVSTTRGSVDAMFSLNEDIDLGPCVQRVTTNFDGIITAIEPYWNDSALNVAVSSANSPAFVFSDAVNNSFQEGKCLKFSSRWDAIQALCVADVDFDGNFEIIVGTFGCTLLVYKFMEQISQWVIAAHHKLPTAIFGVDFIDSHLSVITASGLHIIAYSAEDAI